MKVGVLLLAGGVSLRFGSDKRQAVLASGESLLMTTIRAIQDSGLPLLFCLGRSDTALQDELQAADIASTLCPVSNRGMGHTLAHGVQHRPQDWNGVLVALADMPWVRAKTYAAIARSLRKDNIVVPCHQDMRGNPVGFGSNFFGQLIELEGDIGARSVTGQFSHAVLRLPVDDPGIHRDIDTRDMLQSA